MSATVQQKVEAILGEQYPLQDLAADADLPEIIHRLRARQIELEQSETLNRTIIDGLSANIAVLNEAGDIIAVNEHWLEFGTENEADLTGGINEGVNYLAVCRAAAAQNDRVAQQALDGIEAILQGKNEKFALEYPCHAPHEQRWYIMRVTPLPGAQRGVIVAHEKITERKQLEETLRENEARFRLLTEKASDLICLHDPDGRYLYLSPSCERLLGYKPEELVEHNPYELLHPEDIKRFQTKSHDRARRGKEVASITYRIRRKSGEYIWFDTYTQPVLNNHGQVTRLISASRDVTEQKQVEEELRATQERLSHIIAASPMVIYALEFKNGVPEPVWVSDYTVQLFGYTIPEVLDPKWWLTNLHPEDREQAVAAMPALFEADHLIREYRFQRKDGTYLWIRDELRLLRDEADNPVEAIGTWADTTRRKEAELALQDERALLAQRVEERTTELVWLNQRLLKSQQITEALYEFDRVLMTGEDGPALLETSAAQISHILPADRVLIYLLNLQTRQVTHFAKGGPGVASTSRFTFAELWDGLTGWVIRQRKPVLSDGNTPDPRESEAVRQRRAELKAGAVLVVPLEYQGQMMGTLTAAKSQDEEPFTNDDLEMVQSMADSLVLALRNINLTDSLRTRTDELSTANAELAWAARLKDEFLANMSHELRTPLNAILGMSEVLQMETYGRLNDKQLGSLKHIEEGGRHLLSLINDILDLSKIEAGQLELNLDTIPVEDVCQASLRFVQQQALKKQVKLVSEIDPQVKTLEVDERRLKQILVNLLTNAVKFTPSGGRVGLEVNRDADKSAVCFTVWDTGVGISEEDLQKLFQPFVQLDSSLAKEHEGTGLGLHLVQNIIERHKGRMRFQSVYGQGSTFGFEFRMPLP